MSQKIPLQDSNFSDVWREMERIEPLTPNSFNDIYRKAAESDEYLFGDYDYCTEWLNETEG